MTRDLYILQGEGVRTYRMVLGQVAGCRLMCQDMGACGKGSVYVTRAMGI